MTSEDSLSDLDTDAKSSAAIENFALAANLELQYFMRAYEYLYAAEQVWKNRPIPNSMMAPVLNLECHAIELVLKANMLLQGRDSKAVEKYGHNLLLLWQDASNNDLRTVAQNLERAWSGTDSNLVANAVEKLGKVYSPGKKQFPLRYSSEPYSEAPVPNLTISVFMCLCRIGIEQVIENGQHIDGAAGFRERIRESYYFKLDVWNIFAQGKD
jgi:hypothetical protein